MVYIILALFFVTAVMTLFEDYVGRYKWPVYVTIGLLLILVAGLREVGIDPDSSNYEYTYLTFDNVKSGTVEYSFILLSWIFNQITSDVHILFLFYAFWGVTLKLYAITKFGNRIFLAILVYISYYYIMHECMQIRTGVMSGLILLAIVAMGDCQKKKALVLMLIGSFFHASALALLPTLFLSNKEMTRQKKIIWGMVIPVGYLLSIMGFSVLMSLPIDIPYIGEKLSAYQQGTEKGLVVAAANIFSPIQMLTVLMFYYLLFFERTIQRYDRYYPLLIKYFALGIFFFTSFSFFPVVAQRLNMLFQIVTIILYADIFYTIRPTWASTIVVMLVGLIYLNYSIPNIGLTLLWKV